eukprot:TRINITY_DN103691_c0_g1_i1.p1 TRINITY_DN103691_c0_g1~~TRINITY_DN103691_c0_g1_i1.p1  ORF type:complete len:231 (-),score=33.08 TRINITY_DN103691_c0_g1_i1:76-768(-)
MSASSDSDSEDAATKEANAKAAKAEASKPNSKSADSAERDALMQEVYDKHIGMTDEELTPLIPVFDGKLSSIGAMLHAQDKCKACVHSLMAKGCVNGIRCKFCHGPHDLQLIKQQRKEKRLAKRDALRAAGKAEPNKRRKGRGGGGGRGRDRSRSRSDSDSEPILDALGNSRPSWLRSERSSHCGYPYGPPPMPAYPAHGWPAAHPGHAPWGGYLGAYPPPSHALPPPAY